MTDRTRIILEDLEAVRDCRHETRRGDAFEIMAQLVREGQQFDVVVVDPPSFAQNETSVRGAMRAYARLTDLAVHLVADGGLLFQASCSSRVTTDAFFVIVESTAAATRADAAVPGLGRSSRVESSSGRRRPSAPADRRADGPLARNPRK